MANYCSPEDVKARLGITSADWDVVLEGMCAAVSRRIDRFCGRSFQAAASGTRYYDAHGTTVLFVDDFTAVTTLTVDDESWAATDYIKYPLNAPNMVPPSPYMWLEVDPDGAHESFAGGRKAVEMVADWGFNAAIPSSSNLEDIWDAAVEYACWMLKRAQAAYQDVAGIPELGTLVYSKRMPTAVQLALEPFKRIKIG